MDVLVPPVSEQPIFRLTQWIFAEAYGHYYLVGHHADLIRLRRTTALVSFDIDNLTCRTQSGRLYELDLPSSAGDVAQELLEFFHATTGLRAVDSTLALLADPDLIFKKFVITDSETGHLVRAESRLQKMVDEPSAWLQPLVETMTKSDVDPSLIKDPLGLSELQWRSFKKGTLLTVPMATAFRGLLIEEIFAMAAETIDVMPGSESSTPETSSLRIPAGVLNACEIHELLNMHCAWARHIAGIESLHAYTGFDRNKLIEI